MSKSKPNPAAVGIQTVYYRIGLPPIMNSRSRNANRAVATAVAHMQINQYGSPLCEVHDLGTGELHAVIKRNVQGRITIDYRRDPQAFETRYSIAHLLGLTKEN